MIRKDPGGYFLAGPKGSIPIQEGDEITLKLGMLFEGECEGIGPKKAAEKFGFTRQRYHQLNKQFKEGGAEALKSRKSGPKGNYKRTDEVIRRIIRHRFLDPQISPEAIARELCQSGYQIAVRSVERVITEYGLQKKAIKGLPVRAQKRIETWKI